MFSYRKSLITRTFLDQQSQNRQLEEVVDHPLKINSHHVSYCFFVLAFFAILLNFVAGERNTI